MFHFNYSAGAMKSRPVNTSLFTPKSLYKCRTLIQTPLAFGTPEGFEPNLTFLWLCGTRALPTLLRTVDTTKNRLNLNTY
jgi:hypothetical protein